MKTGISKQKPNLWNDQSGDTTTIIIATLSFLAITLAGLSGWAYYEYHQARETVDTQIEEAVSEAREQQRQEDEARFEEEQRNPFRTYTAPSVYGAIEIAFPKNWNVYVEDDTSDSLQIDLFIHPDMIRMQDGTDRPFAFRMQLHNELYQDIVDGYQSEIEDGEIESSTATASDIEGVRLSGQITDSHSGEMIILPYRDKTVQLWTEGGNYRDQFSTILERADISR